jgi:hypothetical protein
LEKQFFDNILYHTDYLHSVLHRKISLPSFYSIQDIKTASPIYFQQLVIFSLNLIRRNKTMKKFIKAFTFINLIISLIIFTGLLHAQVTQQRVTKYNYILPSTGITDYSYSQDLRNSNDANEDTSWKYLGRVRPGLTTLRFPPDSLLANSNWMWHGTPIFSPDLKEMFWTKYNHTTERGELVFIKYINGNWTSMKNASFGNINYFENNPQYSISGDTLFFVSLRQGGFVFRVIRAGSGWTEPEIVNIPIPSGYRTGLDFSIARSGTIYFGMADTAHPLASDLYRAKYINGQYQMPENLGSMVNSDSGDTCPFIDPYERFILFGSKRPGGYGWHDIYISKRNPDDTWNNPLNLGPTINTSFEDVFPSITPDGLYFFYETAKYGDIGYNPYWINIQYIYNLISIGIKNLGSEIPNRYSLSQNYPNPFNPSTKIKFSIPPANPLDGGNGDEIVKLLIYNILGKEMTTLVNEKLSPGEYEVEWHAGDYPSGIYFNTLTAGSYKETKRMVMIK